MDGFPLASPFLLACVWTSLLIGCSPKKDHPNPTAAADAATDGGEPSDGGRESDGAVDRTAARTNPVAQKLCTGLVETPEKKRAACCGATAAVSDAAACARTLGTAIQDAAVEVDDAAVDACIKDFDKALDGCDWVGATAPAAPASCQGVVKGVLSFGQKCRSSLECGGSLRCMGMGTTTSGRCSAPSGSGELCGATVDALATYLRQIDIDKQHPECASGRCTRHRCAAPAHENGECQVTLDCDDGLQCIAASAPRTRPRKGGAPPAPARKCVRRAVPREGESCPGGICAAGLGCVMNRCTARRSGGAACTSDSECRGGCVRTDSATKGTCGPRCDLR